MASSLPGETGHLSDLLADASLQIVAKLFKNAIDPDAPGLTLASFTEADFAGYAPVTVAGWGMCEDDVAEVGEGVSDPIVFRAGEGVAPQIIYGCYIVSRQGNGDWKLWDFVAFTNPVTITREGQSFELQARATSVNFPDGA